MMIIIIIIIAGTIGEFTLRVGETSEIDYPLSQKNGSTVQVMLIIISVRHRQSTVFCSHSHRNGRYAKTMCSFATICNLFLTVPTHDRNVCLLSGNYRRFERSRYLDLQGRRPK